MTVNEQWRLSWQRAGNHEGVARGLRALLALGCLLLLGWWGDWQEELMPVVLGVLAGAMTETDDHWRGRLRAVLLSLACFALMISAVWLALPWPWLLMALLALSAWGLTLLGAIGENPRALAFGALVVFIYTALAAHSEREGARVAAPLLLTGAGWYGLLSVLWAAWLPEPPLRHRLAQLYALLGEYLRLKALLLEPVRDADLTRRRMALALHNGRVVDALNTCKQSLFSRLGHGAPPPWLKVAMHQYLAAQDIHERASSSHESYALLADAFFHSDALYRCQRVLTVLGEQALKFADAIRQQSVPDHAGATARALEAMQAAIEHQQHGGPARPARPMRALIGLGDNLTALAQVFAGVMRPPTADPDLTLLDRHPRDLADAWARVRRQFTRHSPLWRHAVRLSVSLVAGFMVMQASHDPHGYWILLTIVFTSQPQFGATLKRLSQRVAGTVLGLAVGWALIRLFPGALAQSAFSALAGAVFVANRQSRFMLAAGAMTTLVLLSFHQMGMAQGVIPARLLDTAVGGGIAALAAWWVLPNWQSRHWPRLAAQALRAQAGYLEAILLQYQSGKLDDLAYRTARRDAHNADAALSNAYAAMLKEPARVRRQQGHCERFLVLSHMLLNYLSALGAHRGEREPSVMDARTRDAGEALTAQLLALARDLEGHPTARFGADEGTSSTGREDPLAPAELPLAQLQLAAALLPDLARQVAQLRPAVSA
jgi:YccS/YhfK family integral membrane protein